jgi:hypothetical protein
VALPKCAAAEIFTVSQQIPEIKKPPPAPAESGKYGNCLSAITDIFYSIISKLQAVFEQIMNFCQL